MGAIFVPERHSQVTDDQLSKHIITCTSTTRPASPVEGQIIYETDTDKVMKNVSSTSTPNWQDVAPASGGSLLLSTVTVSGSAVTSVQFTGLDGNAHGGYVLVAEVVGASAGSNLSLFVGGDTTATNYKRQTIWAVGISIGSDVYDDAIFMTVNVDQTAQSTVDISLINGIYAIHSSTSKYISTSSVASYINAIYKKASITNITQLDIICSIVNGIGVNSKFSLYRRK